MHRYSIFHYFQIQTVARRGQNRLDPLLRTRTHSALPKLQHGRNLLLYNMAAEGVKKMYGQKGAGGAGDEWEDESSTRSMIASAGEEFNGGEVAGAVFPGRRDPLQRDGSGQGVLLSQQRPTAGPHFP